MSDIDNVSKVLKKHKIKTRNLFGKYKSLSKILKQISKKWDSLSMDDQNEICHSFAGEDPNITKHAIALANSCGVSQDAVKAAYSKVCETNVLTDDECWSLVEATIRTMNGEAKF